MTDVFDPNAVITMTPDALKHARIKLDAHEGAVGIRLFLKKTGCSGYSYVTEYATEKRESDQYFDLGKGVSIIVSDEDLSMIKGTQIDFKRQGLNAVFVFNNPNATGECGCGESISF